MESEELALLEQEPVSPVIPVYELNPDQVSAKEILLSICMRQSPYSKAVLTGHAGFGKSFLINRVMEELLRIDNVGIGMTAPTHKAVRQLRKMSQMKDRLIFGTIHSLLGLKEHVDAATGRRSFKPDYDSGKERRIDSVRILIVDESSMLHDDLYEHIEDEQRNRSSLVVIYMGDPMQIPPVRNKEDERKVYRDAIPFLPERQKSHSILPVNLTIPMRQKEGNPILDYANNFRINNKQTKPQWTFREEDKHALEKIPRMKEDLFRVLSLFDTPEWRADTDYIKVITYKNNTAEQFNDMIRRIIYKPAQGELLPHFLVGEQLIMNEAYVRESSVVIPNNEEVVLIHTQEVKHPVKWHTGTDPFSGRKDYETWEAKVFQVVLETPEGIRHKVEVLHPEEQSRFEQIRNQIRNAAIRSTDRQDKSDLWKLFYRLPAHFAWVNYNYCITAHKAQGSTYQYAVTMEFDMDANRNTDERNRIKYVAASRASKKLFVIQ